ncbi:MAG: hypothetical protein IJM02_00395 [Clostridia bacterium]|nr:hypothetical protein [Clostridia bacterium]
MNDLNFKDLIAKAKGLPTKTKNIILLIVGIAIFLLAYTMGFQKIQEKTAVIQEEVGKQSVYVNELKGYHDNIQTYEKGIEDSKNTIDGILVTLPRGINSEDFLMYIKTMNEDLGSNLKSVHIDADSFLGEFPCIAEDKSVTIQSFRSGASFSADMTYAQFKDSLKYIYDNTNQITFVESVGLTYDSENAKLQTSFKISKYYITYDGSKYVFVPVPDVALGNSDPFGTASN